MSERTYETVLWQQDGRVGTVTINRPDAFNGINNTMMRELWTLLRDVAADESVAVLVLTGAGKAFCPGADLKAYSANVPMEPNKDEYFEIPVLLHEMPQVTVAAINGACAGAGMGWACACDLRYVARSAKLNTAFLDVAVAGDMGLPWTLPRLVGAGVARELSLFPRRIEADEAVALGLVNAAFDDETFADEVRARVETLAGKAPLAFRGLKAHYVQAEAMGFGEFITTETTDHGRITASADCKEAFRAFVEKRTPTFQGK
jgi:2-(1,2-epoxy-1,2-dihydrophenyl)acetyl-CoA isomerase